MSKRKEKISAFLDGDMHRDELMSFSLSAQADDVRVTQRYQLVGDVLRDELSDSSFIDVSAAVRESLSGENIVSENIIDDMPQKTAAVTTPESTSSRGLFDLSAWFRPAAGMAMAVVVAVVMVVSVSDDTGSSVAPIAANEPVNVDARSLPVVQLAADDKVSDKENAVDQRRVNQHLEFATQDTLQGRLPFVRAVSFEAEK